MSRIIGYRIFVNGAEIPGEDFRHQYLVSLCGEEDSRRVMNYFEYQIYAYCEDPEVRARIEHFDAAGAYVESRDLGVLLRFRCRPLGKICDVYVVKCELSASRPR